jgi:hypothetical protein
MPVASTVLLDLPQKEIASLIEDSIGRSTSTSIVTGFATPDGLAAISAPIQGNPQLLNALVIGAATYPAFEALDDLISAGVQTDRLHIHLGDTYKTGGRKNPFARYHPMLHSKVYYMELPDSNAIAFIGSHNMTSFALCGQNGEASVMLEGPLISQEFERVRRHIRGAQNQAVKYSSALKEAYAWWWREYIDGLRAEVGLPQDWTTVRTILIFASAAKGDRPKADDHLYFEIPAGIEQIESLKTEAHLFLFATLPPDPSEALTRASSADARYTCLVRGAETRQGNLEVTANWRIEGTRVPVLRPVVSGSYRPTPSSGMQQVRAEVKASNVTSFEYLFERERVAWDPVFSSEDVSPDEHEHPSQVLVDEVRKTRAEQTSGAIEWKLVRGLAPRLGLERDQAALRLAAPESGSFILVSLRRRKKGQSPRVEEL